MEPAGEPRHTGASALLEAVALYSWDGKGGEAEGRSSPLPEPGGSASSDESEPEPPPAKPRRVSFADAFGLDLVSVKEFDTRDTSVPSAGDPLETSTQDSEEYFLSSLFMVPTTAEELLEKLEEQKCELECIELLPGTTALRGIIRVLNLCYSKTVYVRTSLDNWSSHFDLLAEFIPGSSDGVTDKFMFKLTLVPPFNKEGARIEFCLRYETSIGTFWANNNGMNYVVFCHQRGRDLKEKQQEDASLRNKKSCLKAVRDRSPEANAAVNSVETADVHGHAEEAVVRETSENPTPEGLRRRDNHQKSPVESEQITSRRSRRRAARLARIRDRFNRAKIEAQQGDVSAQDEESRNSELLWPSSEIITPSLKGPAPHTLGICDRGYQINGEKDQTLSSLQPDGSGSQQLLTDADNLRKGGAPDILCHNRQEDGMSHDLFRDTMPAKGQDSSHIFVNAEDIFPSACTTTEEETVSQSSPSDSAATPTEPIIRLSHTGYKLPVPGENSENQVISGEMGTLEHSEVGVIRDQQSDDNPMITNSQEADLFHPNNNLFKFETFVAPLYQQAFCRIGAESQSITREYEEGDQVSEESDEESLTDISAVDSHLTVEADIQPKSPVDPRMTAADWCDSSYETLPSASDGSPSTDMNPSKQTEHLYVQNHNIVTLMGTETLSEEGVGSLGVGEGVHVEERKNRGDYFTVGAELISISGHVGTQTETIDTAATHRPLHTDGADRCCDVTAHSSAITEPENNVRGPDSNMTFTSGFREKEKDDTKGREGDREEEEREEETPPESKKDFDKGQKESVKREELIDEDKEVPMDKTVEDKENVLFGKEEEDVKVEGVSTEHEALNEKVSTEHLDLNVEEVSMEHEDIDEKVLTEHLDLNVEDVLTKYEDLNIKVSTENEGLDVDVLTDENNVEEVTTKNEELSDEEVSTENEHFNVEEEPAENENFNVEEVSAENKDLNAEKLSAENVIIANLGDEEVSNDDGSGGNDEESTKTDDDFDKVGERIPTEDFAKDQSELAMENTQNFNNEEEEVLRGQREELNKGENELSVEREDLEEEDREDIREGAGDLSTKIKDDALIEEDVSLHEEEEALEGERQGGTGGGGKEFSEEGHEGEGLYGGKAEHEGEGDTTSTESLTDDEMELHMYSWKSAHKQELAQTAVTASRSTSSTASKRPSVSRARMLPLYLSSIRESLNEDGDGEEPSFAQENILHVEKSGDHATIKLPPVEKVENVARSFLSAWRECFSFSHVSRACLYILLCLLFFITAYYYDFLACFALYLFSVYWLCFHGEKQRLQGTSRIE